MGYYCVLIPIREPVLMHLDEREVAGLFEREGRPDRRRTSLALLEPYEHPWMADRPLPTISLEAMSIALHLLLTGSIEPVASPVSRAILGGTRIGPDVGDGPARYLWAHEVREISDALPAITLAKLRRRYDPAGMKSRYLWTGVSEDEDEEDLFDGLSRYFSLLATFYRIAARRGSAVLIGVV